MNVALPFRSEPALRRTIDHSLIPPRETNNSGTIAENVTTTASSSITSPEDNIGLTVNCLKLDRLSLHNEMPCVIPTEQEDFLPNQDRLLISVKKFERLTVSSNADKKSRYNEDFDITECNSITEEECSTVSSHEDTSDTELLWQAAIRNPDEKQRLALYWTLCYPDIADNHSTTQSREHIHNDTLDRKKSCLVVPSPKDQGHTQNKRMRRIAFPDKNNSTPTHATPTLDVDKNVSTFESMTFISDKIEELSIPVHEEQLCPLDLEDDTSEVFSDEQQEPQHQRYMTDEDEISLDEDVFVASKEQSPSIDSAPRNLFVLGPSFVGFHDGFRMSSNESLGLSVHSNNSCFNNIDFTLDGLIADVDEERDSKE